MVKEKPGVEPTGLLLVYKNDFRNILLYMYQYPPNIDSITAAATPRADNACYVKVP